MADDAAQAEKPELRIGSYRLTQQLGSGGMSSVFRAVHEESGHEVAVKVLPRTLAKNPTLLQRFLREAKAAEALEHPNIVAIYDRGVDQGRNYLVLEYMPGGDLHDRVRNEGPLPVAEAIRIIKEVATGLAYAASLGLIHRDIKPANILVSPTGQVKIIDLGLALQAEAEDERVTRDGTTVGTVDYMSPEQARDSRATSEKSDMYSLGCTLYFLLTGSAPFAGGDLADKLARHCTQPAPDPRQLRPDVPAGLAALTRRMMAKRPENRFASYAALIAALDAVKLGGEPGAPQGEVLDALIDDEDDLAPESGAPALSALIADDSDDALPVTKPVRASRPREAEAPPVDVLSMADLAALDDDTPAAKPARRPRPAATPTPAPELTEALLDDAHEEHVAALPGRARNTFHFGDASSKSFIKRCVAIGVAVMVLVIGALKLIDLAREKPSNTFAQAETEEPPSLGAPAPRLPSGPAAPAVTVVRKVEAPKAQQTPKAALEWKEPADPPPWQVAEPAFGSAVEARFVPAWAAGPVPERVGTTLVNVRRLTAPGAADERPNVRMGLDVIGAGSGNAATLELADNGPFCEDDLRVLGDARLIRARSGFRPIVKVEAPKLPIVREQPAVIVLDGKQLVLDGIDLTVNVEDLPRHQSAVFECAGGTLTLRNCTVTVLNPKSAPFAVVRTVPAARPSRVRLEQCVLRGPSLSALTLSGGTVEAVVSRSVLLTGSGPAITVDERDPASECVLSFVRSIVASRAPFVSWEITPGSARTRPVAVRALGCTFAAVAGASPPILMYARGASGAAAERVRWQGDHNVFAGWNGLYAGGSDAGGTVGNLAAARRAWGTTDAASVQQPNSWPDAASFDRVVPEQLRSLAPDRLATLSRVAIPSPFLHEKTFLAFERRSPPNLARDVMVPNPAAVAATPAPAVFPPVPTSPPLAPAVRKEFTNRPVPVAPKPAPAPASAAAGPLVFDTTAAPWNGDLGLYLRDHVKDAEHRLRVFVKGAGMHLFTPFACPPGVSLEILGDPARAPEDVPTWSPAASGASADALIVTRGADLVLSGVNFARGASALPKVLFRVDRGHFVAYRCRMLAHGLAAPGDGGLIAFRADSTEPLPSHPGPFAVAVDRPTCRLVDCTLIAAGDALAAEVGRGRVALTNCAVAAGGGAFVLTPAKVARVRFDADLWLDHCTVTAEHDVVRLEPWKGSDPGPDRPWLVTSVASAFLASFTTGAREHVLLRSEGESVAHGAVFWQGSGDAFELPHFTAIDDRAPGANPRPDMRRQWLELWGANHFRNALGPGTGKIGAPSAVRFAEKLKPGEVTPRDLVLEVRERRASELGADAKVLKLNVPVAQAGRGQ